MIRAISRAGQFAHLEPSQVAWHLDRLYDISARTQWLGDRRYTYEERADLAEASVPMALVRARRGRLLAAPAYEADTANFIASELGAICCLCLAVEYPTYFPPLDVDGRDSFHCFFSKTHLRGTGVPSLCSECVDQLRFKMRAISPDASVEPDVRPLALAWLAANPRFRARVKANARRASELKFDPRRIPERRLAA